MSQSNFLQGSQTSRLSSSRRFSDFQMIAGDELSTRSKAKPSHEIGCGGNDALMMAVDIATDVNNLVSKEDAGSNTKQITTQDSSVGSNPVVMSSIGCQNITKT